MSAIIVEQLTQRVRDADGWLTILDNINFSLAAGASLAIVGASGSGKSTLLGLMAGLDQPSTGQVKVFGTDLFAMNEDARAAWRAKHVGFVFQTFQLLPQMSALENVMLPLELSGAPNARTRAQALLKDVGLEARFHHYPRTLSGGEQQRVALARAFVAQPALLFADEPTGSLDSATGERVIELMLKMNQQHQTTLILVTHDEALAARCDRQLRLTAGRIESLSPEPTLPETAPA